MSAAREILFRGKRMDNGRWVYGDLRQDADLNRMYINGWTHYTEDREIERAPFEYEVDPDTVGQYTGLTDKNDVKIFEGDIVLVYEYQIYVVKFSLERMGFEPFAKGDGCGCCEVDTVRYEYQSIEVIGETSMTTPGC